MGRELRPDYVCLRHLHHVLRDSGVRFTLWLASVWEIAGAPDIDIQISDVAPELVQSITNKERANPRPRMLQEEQK